MGKQRSGRMQVLPLFVLQFKQSTGSLARQLSALGTRDAEAPGALAGRQRGGLRACEARRDAKMVATSTRHIWVGWLSPDLCSKDDDTVMRMSKNSWRATKSSK